MKSNLVFKQSQIIKKIEEKHARRMKEFKAKVSIEDPVNTIRTLNNRFIRKKHTEEMQMKQLVFPKQMDYLEGSICTNSSREYHDSKRPMTVDAKAQRRQ